jgi:hypothetical protein
MTTSGEVTRIVRSWLKSETHESADRVLDAVLDALPAIPQRRASLLTRRSTRMSTTLRIAAAAAALVVAAVLGYQLLSDRGVEAGNSPCPTPSASGATP